MVRRSFNSALWMCGGLLVWLVVGCGLAEPDPVSLETANVEPNASVDALAICLREGVTDDGLMRPEWLRDNRDDLRRQLRLFAVTGPTVTPELYPTEADRIAYWYNARAGWAIMLAILGQYESDDWRLRQLPRRFPLDGRSMSLALIDDELASRDDWRIVAAAPGASLQRARLPSEPFDANGVRECIADRLDAFLDDEQRFVIDVEAQAVRVPPVLWRVRERILAEYRNKYDARGANLLTALLPHASTSTTRRLQDAVGYRIVPAKRRSRILAILDEFGEFGSEAIK
ncbi:MAG: hypothetical protein ACOCZU_00600 [Planctomycetota bacterium]